MNFEVNEVYLRTSPLTKADGSKDWAFCTTPIKILQASKEVLYCFTEDSEKGRILGNGPRILSPAYQDNSWEKVSDILLGDEDCALDYWFAGRKLYRRKPLEEVNEVDDSNFGYSFDVLEIKRKKRDWRFVGKQNAVTLISATKHHVVVEKEGEKIYLDERYTQVSDWDLA